MAVPLTEIGSFLVTYLILVAGLAVAIHYDQVGNTLEVLFRILAAFGDGDSDGGDDWGE